MILYKYVSFRAGRKILESASLGFTQPEFFNDPFDMPVYPGQGGMTEISQIPERLRVMGQERSWADNTGILSLTRTATNALMWAHYANQHRGMVIGVDVVAAGLTDEARNLVPAQYGSVIYVSRRSSQPFVVQPATNLAAGATHRFSPEHYEHLQRLFLHKPLCWSYEEEVRVVKCLEGLGAAGGQTASGRFNAVEVEGRSRQLLILPDAAIREVHIGFRADQEAADALHDAAKERFAHLSVFQCHLLPESFSVGADDYITLAQTITG